jgi:N-hydroxyarylamine O-acetyltransferase
VHGLDRYLERIGYTGPTRADLATLRALHRAHLLAIPYENFDVQLGRPVGLAIGPIYRKLVEERRGGWCFEMNGLFAWALEEIGFELTRMAAGVRRDVRGIAALGNHLALLVRLERPYLADVGFGQGPLEPAPLVAGPIPDRGFVHELTEVGDGWWRFHGRTHPTAPSFDFRTSAGDRALFEEKCAFMQTSPESPFTQVTVVQRHLADGIVELRGRSFRRLRADHVEERVIADRDDYATTLRHVFGANPPEIDVLWAKAVAQHDAFVGAIS